MHEINDALLNLIGYSREELAAGQVNWVDLTPVEYTPLDELAHEEGLRFGACTPFEKELGLSKPVGPLHGAHEEEDRVIAVRPGENAFLLRVNEVIEAAKADGAGS